MKEIFRSALRRAGWQVLRYTPSTSFEAQLAKLFSVHGIDLLLDVGANAGQYASTMRRAGYGGDILSFEPLAEPWSRCSERTRSDPSWTIAPRMAVGDRDGAVEMHVAANSVSSSILDMKDSHRRAAPGSAYTGSETVDVRRLDTVARGAILAATRPFLKVDTQGYEGQVLEGASGVLDHIAGVQLEMSLVPLYEGSAGFGELLVRVRDLGFEPYGLWPGFTDPASGRTLQVDGVFFRREVTSLQRVTVAACPGSPCPPQPPAGAVQR